MRAKSVEKWRRIFAEQAASGLNVSQFCRERGVPKPSFYHWRKKLESMGDAAEPLAAPEAPAFVQLKSVVGSGRSEVTIQLPQATVRIADCSNAMLASALSTLSAPKEAAE